MEKMEARIWHDGKLQAMKVNQNLTVFWKMLIKYIFHHYSELVRNIIPGFGRFLDQQFSLAEELLKIIESSFVSVYSPFSLAW